MEIFGNFEMLIDINRKKDKAYKPCLYYYTGGRGRTGTSLRTLDFESNIISFKSQKY